MLFFVTIISAQTKADSAKIKSDEDIVKRATEWTSSLQLNDTVKLQRVAVAIAIHLKAVRNWNNEHSASTVPAGINPATGNKLSELDRQVIAMSAMPLSVHQTLMNALSADLTSEQVERILDKYTMGKVDFTWRGYKAIVPDLTADEETKILLFLKEAREQAIDYKNAKQISAIFEIYKTKCEQYLNSNGRNWHQLYKVFTDKIKAEKQAKQQHQ